MFVAFCDIIIQRWYRDIVYISDDGVAYAYYNKLIVHVLVVKNRLSCVSYVQVLSFFRSQATSAQVFSAYRSIKYYGFMLAFLVKLKPNTNQSVIASAHRSVVNAWHIEHRYYFVSYNRESRGVRAFMPSSECVHMYTEGAACTLGTDGHLEDAVGPQWNLHGTV